jgi:2-hydroxychromene-2-carboxylate isomerase
VADGTQPVFYYDLGNPECYLAAERVSSVLPAVAEWEPVLEVELGAAPEQVDRQGIEQRAAERGLQPLRWPQRWPPDTRLAIRAATYAKQVGRAVAFSLAAFRQAFAGGRDLSEPDTVLIAAAACELHPAALLKGVELRSVALGLERATARARAAGVRSLPAVEVGERVFAGDAGLEHAAAALRCGPAPETMAIQFGLSELDGQSSEEGR